MELIPYQQLGDVASSPPDANLSQLINILRRRRRSILAVALIGTALTFAVGAMIPPEYTAKAQIVLDLQTADLGDGRQPSSAAEMEAVVQTDITALTARPFLQHVLQNLSQDPDFRAAARPPRGIQWLGDFLWRNTGGRLRELMSDFAAPEASSGPSLTPSQLRRLDAFERNVNVYQERDSHVIAVKFNSSSPEQAAMAANRIVQLFIAGEQERKRADATRVAKWLDQRIPEVASGLEQDETAVQNYLTSHNLAGANANGAADQRGAELNRQLAAAESDLAKRQAQLAAIHDLRQHGASAEAIVAQLDSPADVELLRQRDTLVQAQAEAAVTYGANHPKVQQLAAQLQQIHRALTDDANRAVDRLTSEARAASDNLLTIRRQLAGLQSAKSQAEPRLRELNYQAAAAGQLYEGLLQNRARLNTQQETTLPDLRIMALASPPNRPSSFSPFLFILPSLIAFAVGGGLVSIAAERLDQGLRSDYDIIGTLGIPCVGLVPRMRGLGRARPHRRLLSEPFTAYAEAIRSVVASLQVADGGGLPKTILVTSSVPGEGKTTLAVSIAAYAAHIGRRVLLVDLDLRHPGVLRELGGKIHRDVLDLLIQGSLPEDVVQRRRGFQFDYIPASRRAYDLFPLFADERMAQALNRLRESYDLVIIDSPPLLAVTETRMLAGIVDKILFVVRWGGTRRDIAQNALNLLRGSGLVTGDRLGKANAVVTQVDLKKHADYRYGDTGESAMTYAEYYTTPSRKTAAALALRRIVRLGRRLMRYGRVLVEYARQIAMRTTRGNSAGIREPQGGESNSG